MSGAPAQPNTPVPGQQYGMGVQQMDMQRALPTPQNLQQTVPVTPATAQQQPTGVSNQAVGAQPVDPHAAALAEASAMRQHTGILTRPTSNPNEPITAGLGVGPGPGPEVLGLRTRSATADTLERLSQVTGDPLFRDLARKAGL